MKRNIKNHNAGFTILELLISMTIVIMLLGVIYTSFSAGSRACTVGGQQAESLHTARLAMQDIMKTIENVEYGETNSLSFIEVESDGLMGEVSSDILEFATIAEPTKIDGRWRAGLARVRYAVVTVKDEETDEEKSILQKWVTRLDDEDFEDAYILELSENISDLSFRYYDPEDQAYADEWDSETDEGLPEMVEITMYIQEGENLQPFRSLVMIPDMKVDAKSSASPSTSARSSSGNSSQQSGRGNGVSRGRRNSTGKDGKATGGRQGNRKGTEGRGQNKGSRAGSGQSGRGNNGASGKAAGSR